MSDDSIGFEWLPNKLSWGWIINDFISSQFYENNSILKFIENLIKNSKKYNSFNLIIGNIESKKFYFVDMHHEKYVELALDKW